MTTEDQCPSKDTPSEVKEDIEDRNETEGVDRKRRMSGSNLLWGEDERMVRKTVAKGFSGNIFSSFFVNGYSAVLIFTFYLISLESLLSIALSVSMTIFAYNRTEDNESFDGSIMSWTLLSFAVITPMSASVGMAFKRRDKALDHLAVLKSTLFNIYSAHACWDWCKKQNPQSGRAASDMNWLDHCDKVLIATIMMCVDSTRMLTLPSASRGRHRVTALGRKEAKTIISLLHKLHQSILDRMTTITDLCEVFKREGLPPNEATRIRQWERMVTEKMEQLLVIKKYRTPQALRSFARLFTVFLPPFYAPYYGQMAKELNSLGMAIAFSVLTSIALTSLFESITQIEDPFIGIVALDGIDVAAELLDEFKEQLICCRRHHFPNAPKFELDQIEIYADAPSRHAIHMPDIRLFQT